MKLLGYLTTVMLVMAGGITLLSSALAQDGADKKELEKFQGKWVPVSAASDGKAAGEDALKDRFSLFKEAKLIAIHKDKVLSTSTMTIDPSKSPAHIDLTYDGGAGKGKTLKGIYKFEGETLTICSSAPGNDRPTEFATKPGSKTLLYVLKRAK